MTDTVTNSLEKLPKSKEITAKIAKAIQYMRKLCSHGKLHTPKQLNREITVIYAGKSLKTYAIKALPLRAYGWMYKGTFYVSFFVVKKKLRLSSQDAETLNKNATKFIQENML